jgi:hypothetical protein
MCGTGSFNPQSPFFAAERTTTVLHVRWLILSLALIFISAAPASSQSRALLVYGQAGRMFPIMNLSEAGDDLSPGRAYGGGLGIQLAPTTALRATVNISESKHRGPTLDLSDPGTTRAYYGLDLMFGAPSDAGLAPYLFFGSGRMTVDPAEPGSETVAELAGRMGVGMNYVPDNSFFVLFLEACGWVYEFEMFGFRKLQFNTSVQGGLVFAFPF